jgi:hypothetical protein
MTVTGWRDIMSLIVVSRPPARAHGYEQGASSLIRGE